MKLQEIEERIESSKDRAELYDLDHELCVRLWSDRKRVNRLKQRVFERCQEFGFQYYGGHHDYQNQNGGWIKK